MEDRQFSDGKECCFCCTRRIHEGGGIKQDNKFFCNEAHAQIHQRYRRLCDQAIEAAKRFDEPAKGKKGEVDYKYANDYLAAELDLPLKSPQPLVVLTPA